MYIMVCAGIRYRNYEIVSRSREYGVSVVLSDSEVWLMRSFPVGDSEKHVA